MNSTRKLLLSAFVMMLLSFSVFSQDTLNIPLIHQFSFWDTPNQIEVNGNFAYISTVYDGIRIVDISDPSAMAETGWLDYGRFFSIYQDDNYLVGSGHRKVIFDLSTASMPELVSVVEGLSFDAAISGNILWSTEGQGGNSLYDISSLQDPVLVSSYAYNDPDWTDERSYEVSLVDTFAVIYGKVCRYHSEYMDVYDLYRYVETVSIADPENPYQLDLLIREPESVFENQRIYDAFLSDSLFVVSNNQETAIY